MVDSNLANFSGVIGAAACAAKDGANKADATIRIGIRDSKCIGPLYADEFPPPEVLDRRCAGGVNCAVKWRPQGDSNPRYRRERAVS